MWSLYAGVVYCKHSPGDGLDKKEGLPHYGN